MECRNLLFVFCRLKRAGGVKQTAIRLETGEGVLKNSALKIRKDADLFGLEPPAGVHPAAKHGHSSSTAPHTTCDDLRPATA